MSRSYFYRLVQGGVIPVVRIGRRVLVPRAALDAWIREHTAIEGTR